MIKLILIVGLLIILSAVGWYAWRNISRKVETVAQPTKPMTTTASAKPLRQGTFGAIDVVHKGAGHTTIYQESNGPILKFESDFSVTRGPDLFVYLSKKSDIASTLSPDLGEYVSLGRLASTTGEQHYALPADADQYHTVVIWCRAFNVLFSKAILVNL